MSAAIGMATVAVYCLLCYGVGRVAIDVAWRPAPALLRCAAAVAGAAILAAQLTVYGVLHVPWNAGSLLAPWTLLAVARRRRIADLLRGDFELLRTLGRESRADRLTSALLVACAVFIVILVARLSTQPLGGNDAIALWMFKAKLYYQLGRVDLSTIPLDIDRHLDYPPFFSLAVATLHVLHGAVSDELGKGAAAVFVLTGAGVVLVATRTLLSTRAGALVTLVFLTMPVFGNQLLAPDEMGYADYPLAVLMMASVACLVLGFREDHQGFGYGAVGLAGLAAVTKNEGLLFLIIILVAVAARSVRRREALDARIAATVALPVLAAAAWRLYSASHGYVSDLATGHHPSPLDLGRLASRADVIWHFALNSASIRSDNGWLTICFVLALELLALKRSRAGAVVIAVVAAQATGYFVVYLFTPQDLVYHLSTSFDRLVLQLAPLVLLVLVLGLSSSGVAGDHPNAPARTDRQAERKPDTPQ